MAGANVLLLRKAEDKRQRDALRMAFKKADVNQDKRLSFSEYCNIVKKVGIGLSEDDLKEIMAAKDVNKDGYISIAEFLGEAMEEDPNKKAELAFDIIDKDKDGFISKQEFLDLSDKITQKQVRAVFARNDKDKDGKISKEEYLEMVRNKKK
eukprot:TRINITY_DN13314_c0_g1_i3.p1 TRINITY_DN13314_c0_g1~~TRINITY_DN13314_c0_g1_i3.p1  ORF type:complete len:159 (-),score=59.22 TRINITY_DN13314_c0_g1_i3:83-538(-)